MRLIDADAFRMELDNHWPFTKEEQSKHGIADMAKSTLLVVLSNMSPIELPHWIPCSERLPLTYEDNIPVVERYIVTVSVDGVLFTDTAYSFGTYIDGFWDTVVDWDEGNEVHVLAWMPFPEPYRDR